MPYAIVLYFDERSEYSIQEIWKKISDNGIPNEIHGAGIRPHITLAIYDELLCQPCDNELARFASKTTHLNISFSHLGIFTNPETVLFLAPTPTRELVNFHSKVHECLSTEARQPWEFYQPGKWVPHCTVALDLDQEQLHEAISLCADLHFPMNLHATQVGAVEFLPMKDLFRFNLKKNSPD